MHQGESSTELLFALGAVARTCSTHPDVAQAPARPQRPHSPVPRPPAPHLPPSTYLKNQPPGAKAHLLRPSPLPLLHSCHNLSLVLGLLMRLKLAKGECAQRSIPAKVTSLLAPAAAAELPPAK